MTLTITPGLLAATAGCDYLRQEAQADPPGGPWG
jgi:hypothetical protein